MQISDMPQFENRTQVLTCDPDQTVYEAVVSMSYRGCGAIVVTKADKLMGIFTERDLLGRVVAHGRDIESTKISDVMSSNIETAKPHDSVFLCMGRMNHGGYRHMPVTDKDDKLIGILSQRDFISYTMDHLTEKIE